MNFSDERETGQTIHQKKIVFFFFLTKIWNSAHGIQKKLVSKLTRVFFFDWNKFLTKDLILYPFQRDIERVTCIKIKKKNQKNIAVRARLYSKFNEYKRIESMANKINSLNTYLFGSCLSL
jgi:hypothetical protein